jgi:transcriptional regulator with GAF, ATPase, and Fis domain
VKSREEGLAEIFIRLADTLVNEFDVNDLFFDLVESCIKVVEADHAGLLLADQLGSLQVAASTSADAHAVELEQLKHQEGPCFDAFLTGEEVMIGSTSSAEARERWPAFAVAAAAAGINSVAAVPLRLRQQTLGALNLFRRQEGELSPMDVATARTMADIASIAILQDRAAHDAQAVIEQLQKALDSRVVIEQARGIVAQRNNLDMVAAFAAMRRYSRDHNLRLTRVAADLVSRRLDPATIARDSLGEGASGGL